MFPTTFWRPLVITALFAACSTGELGEPPAVPADEERDPGGERPDAPDAGEPSDASPVETADAGAPNPDCVDQTVNLLANPSFDVGPSGWLENTDFEIIVTPPELVHTPQSPAHAAWLGGYDPSAQALAQRLTIPADAKSIAVRGFRLINSNDTSPNRDILRVFILDADGNVLELLKDQAVTCPSCTYSNTAGLTPTFVPFTLNATGNYAGQEILFHTQSDLPDAGSITNFYLDTMSFDVTVCR